MRFKQKGKKLAALCLACSVIIAEVFTFGHVTQTSAKSKSQKVTKTVRQAQGVWVAYHSKEDIRKYIKANGAAVNDPLEFADPPQTVVPYDPGKLSDKTQQSALNMLKQIRYIAGISDQVQLSDDLCRLAQAASFVNYVNNELSHKPAKPGGMDEALYQLGYQGAQSSNIAWASWPEASLNTTIALSWMEDGDIFNISRVGHRRWLLNPQMGKTGFGAVSGSNGTYSSVYAFDTSNSSASEKGVVWPAQNMPTEYFAAEFPWSISMGDTVNQSKIQVKLVRLSDKKEWTFSDQSSDGVFYVDNGNYGQNGCIIFRPPMSEIKTYKDGDSYEVTITGYTQPISYTVNFFDLITLDSISAEYKGKPVTEGGTVNKADIIVTGTYSDGSTKKITDFTIKPYKIEAGSNDITIEYQDKTDKIKVTGTASKITIQFDAVGGTAVSPLSVEKGSVLTSIPKTTRKGYIFEGWYTALTGGMKLEETTVLDKNITYYAHWKDIELSSLSAEFLGTRVIAGMDDIFEQEDFRVTAVYTDGSRKTIIDYTIDDFTLKEGENTLTIRYGGKSASVKINAVSVQQIHAMYIGGPKDEGTTELDDIDVRLYVKLSDGDTIVVKYPDYSIEPFIIKPGKNILTVWFAGKSQTFEVTGYEKEIESELIGIDVFYTGGSVAVGSKIDRSKLSVKASYSDGSIKVISDYMMEDYEIKEGENTIAVTYQGKSAYFYVTGITTDVQMITLQFDARGGTAVSSRKVAKGSAVGDLPETIKEGYVFEGWYTQAEGGIQVTSETLAQTDVTYYAHWKEESNDPPKPDTPPGPNEPDKPDQPTIPDNPTTPNQPATPDNPTTPNQPTTPDRPAMPDTPPASVTITFDAQGGDAVSPISVTKNNRLSYIPLTHKNGDIFQGWFTGTNGTGSMLTLGTEFSQDAVYYAYWKPANRTVIGIAASANGTAFAGDSVYSVLTVRVIYSDGASEPVYDYTVSQAVLQTGNNLITVNWNGFYQNIQMQAGTGATNTNIRGITVFYNGNEVLVGTYTRFDGLTVKAVYTDGTEREINSYALSGNTIGQGRNIVTVHYEGKTADFVVTGYQYLAVRMHVDGVSDIWVSKTADLSTVLRENYPVRSGYQFSGWYLDEAYTQRVQPGMKAMDGMHVYAKWQQLYNWQLNKSKASVKQGKSVKLSVGGLKNTQITWKTSNKKIATVSKNGVVKAKKAGIAVITAVTPDGSVMSCNVIVRKKAKK